jgi:MSHA pilin protein MshD
MTRAQHRGFTLIELIIFIVVVAAGLAGILSVMNTVVKSSADPMVRKQSLVLADSILEEIMQKAYCDPDPLISQNEATRATMDDVSDFDGKTETLFALPAELSTYKVLIVVAGDTSTLGSAPNVPAKKITVKVTGGTESVSLVGYRARYGDDSTCAP